MAKYLPPDLPKNTFVNTGLLVISGDAWSKDRITDTALYSEIDYVKKNVAQGNFNTQMDWQSVRNVLLHYYCTDRDLIETAAINSFLMYASLSDLDVVSKTATEVLEAVEKLHNKATPVPWSPPDWVKQHPPTQPLPTPSSLTAASQDLQYKMLTPTIPLPPPPPSFHHLQPPLPSPAQTTTGGTVAPTNDTTTTHSSQHPLYTFTDHQQEYQGYQFQCPYRCLKDGKHCRKAPVREMNRHLRDRHHRAHGFKIAGVDWAAKRWRGAGANEPECIGRIVEKDAPDGSSDEDGEKEIQNGHGDGDVVMEDV